MAIFHVDSHLRGARQVVTQFTTIKGVKTGSCLCGTMTCYFRRGLLIVCKRQLASGSDCVHCLSQLIVRCAGRSVMFCLRQLACRLPGNFRNLKRNLQVENMLKLSSLSRKSICLGECLSYHTLVKYNVTTHSTLLNSPLQLA